MCGVIDHDMVLTVLEVIAFAYSSNFNNLL